MEVYHDSNNAFLITFYRPLHLLDFAPGGLLSLRIRKNSIQTFLLEKNSDILRRGDNIERRVDTPTVTASTPHIVDENGKTPENSTEL